MKNTLFKRISKIITANVDSLISEYEGRSQDGLLKIARDEVVEALNDVRDELASVVTRKHLAKKQLTLKNNAHELLSEKISLALEEKREDLAKVAINEQLDIEAQLPIIEHTLHECSEEEKELEGYIFALKAKIKEMEQEEENLLMAKRETTATASPHSSVKSDAERKVEGAERDFNRALLNSGLTSGLDRTDLGNKAKLQELENLERENRIRERLESLKGES